MILITRTPNTITVCGDEKGETKCQTKQTYKQCQTLRWNNGRQSAPFSRQKLEEMEKRLSDIYSGSADIIEKKAAEYFRQFERMDEKKRKQVETGLVYDEAVDGMPRR